MSPTTRDEQTITSKDVGALVPVDESEYAIVRAADPQMLLAAVRENVGREGIGQFDLDRIKIPAGGGKAWEIPSLEGVDVARKFEGIVVAWREPRAFWRVKFDDRQGPATPPDCASDDGELGVGDPGGKCALCPMAEWGSADTLWGTGSRGQACKQMRLLFVLRPDDLIPVAMPMPPTSIPPLKQYFLRLAGQGIPYYAVVTSFELSDEQSGQGIGYSAVRPSMVARLAPDAIARVRAYKEAIQAQLDTIDVTAGDFETAGSGG